MGRPAALTPEQVVAIRLSDKTLKALAEEFKVSLLTVWKVKNGKRPYDVMEENHEYKATDSVEQLLAAASSERG